MSLFRFSTLFSRSPFHSKLFDQNSFYQEFIRDLNNSKKEVIIESPFITTSRMELLYPVFENLVARKIPVHIITRDPVDYDDEYMKHQATNEILQCLEIGISLILLKDHHHRKLAIINSNILWGREIMRRIEGEKYVREMQNFLKLSLYFQQYQHEGSLRLFQHERNN